jgi:hypothetical protein
MKNLHSQIFFFNIMGSLKIFLKWVIDLLFNGFRVAVHKRNIIHDLLISYKWLESGVTVCLYMIFYVQNLNWKCHIYLGQSGRTWHWCFIHCVDVCLYIYMSNAPPKEKWPHCGQILVCNKFIVLFACFSYMWPSSQRS